MRKSRKEDSLPQPWSKLNDFFREIEPGEEVYITDTIQAREAAMADNVSPITPVCLKELFPEKSHYEFRPEFLSPDENYKFEQHGFQFSYRPSNTGGGENWWYCKKLADSIDCTD